MMNSESQYTMTLHEFVEDYDGVLFDFEYDLPTLVNKEKLELAFYEKYYFRELGAETPDRWLLQLEFRWKKLCRKYYHLFEIFDEKFLANNVLDNNDLKTTYENVFSDTPQNSLDDLTDYATNKSKASTVTSGSNNDNKFRLLSEYANKLRIITDEMINDCEPLFMQLF